LHTELSADSFNVDLEMELSHTTDDHLFGLFIDIDGKSWIFSLEFRQCFFEFDCAVVFGGFDSETHDGVGDKHTLASDWETVVSLGKSVSG